MPLNFRHRAHQPGTILVLVLVVITVIVLELAMLSTILVRSFGEEAVTATDNTMARYALQTAFTRIEQDLISYIIANGTTNVTTAFAAGGASAINSASLTATDPETGTTGQTTNVVISASVATKRGYYYKLMATARIGDVNITAYKWVKLNPSASCTASGGLTTIVSGRTVPGGDTNGNTDPKMVEINATTGRIYFGEDSDPGNFYTYLPSTGLSTIVTGVARPGHRILGIDTVTGRVYFGSPSTALYTYLPTTGLSTVAVAVGDDNTMDTHGAFWRNTSVFSDATNGRIYFQGDAGEYFTYAPSTGLSTILVGSNWPGGDAQGIDTVTGRIYFGEGLSTGSDFYTYLPSTGLSTILAGTGKYPGVQSTAVFSSATVPKVIFGSWVSTNGNLYMWTPSGGLSTLLVNRKYSGTGDWGGPAVGFDSTGRAFFGEGGTTTSNFYTYNSGVLSTLARTSSFAGFTLNPVTDRVYFGSGYGGYSTFYTWKSTTGLSTLATGAPDYSPHNAEYAFSPDGTKLFLGEWSNGVYVYDESVGGTTFTYLDSLDGYARYAYDATNNLVFIPDRASTLLIYKPSDGSLSTIAAPGGVGSNVLTAQGYTYFSDSTNGNFYVWSVPSSCP